MSDRARNLLAQRGQRINVIAPRGNAKSVLWTVTFAILVAVEGIERFIWIISDTTEQSRDHLENIAEEFAENEFIREAYPHIRIAKRSRTRLKLSNGATYLALGTGQRVRGRRRGANRPGLVICDDLENDKQVASPDQRTKHLKWFNSALMSAGSPDTNWVMLGSALHRDCLTMIASRNAGWESYIFRSIVEWPKRMDLWAEWERIYCDFEAGDKSLSIEERTKARFARAWDFYVANKVDMDEGAVVLWPAREPLYELMRMRVDKGRNAFEAEYQGNPINPELCEWPEDYFTGDNFWFDDEQLPRDPVLKVVALDPSKGRESKHGDYQSFAEVHLAPSGDLYVDMHMNKEPISTMIDRGVDLYRRIAPTAFAVEFNQWQELLNADFLYAFKQAGVLNPQIVPIENTIKKEIRIRRLTPLLSQRRIHFRRHSAGAKLCVNQMRDFPNGDHDDGPDSLEMAVRLLEHLLQHMTTQEPEYLSGL